jgi:tetraacyldisaccharide 4'-kinase
MTMGTRDRRLPEPLAAPLSAIYGSVAKAHREMSAPMAKRLRAPVVSVGALSAGGSGKTPVAASLARLLLESGERPAILSRGYARTVDEDGVVVVSDGRSLRADLARSGDEPLLLARSLPGVAVLACPDRYLAGCLAESRLGCTVHVLDDGFQHHALARDVDLVIVSAEDVERGRVIPAGRLRESLETLARADAILAPAADVHQVTARVAAVQGPRVFGMSRSAGVPRLVEPWGHPPRVPRSAPVMAVAAIARPDAFFDDLDMQGWQVIARRAFADHHPFGLTDVRQMAAEARASGAALIVTTEKDVMRLLPWRPLPFPVAWIPMRVDVTPDDLFASWLMARIERARAGRHASSSDPRSLGIEGAGRTATVTS